MELLIPDYVTAELKRHIQRVLDCEELLFDILLAVAHDDMDGPWLPSALVVDIQNLLNLPEND